MRARSILVTTLAATAALLLAACGGGGGGASSVPASHPTTSATTPAGPTAQVTLRINTSAGTSSTRRSPKFVSPSMKSLTITLQGQTAPLVTVDTTTSTSCTTTACTVTFAAPVGTDTFVITTFDASGNPLSTVTMPFTVVLNATNTLAATLNGVVATAGLVLSTTSVPAGTPATVSVWVVAYDAQNNVIVGPGDYSTPVTVTNGDTSGTIHLSASQVTAPSTNTASLQLTYNGGTTTGATITPMVGNVPGTPVQFAPSGASLNILSISGGPYVDALVTGSDNNVWVSGSGYIAKIVPAATGAASVGSATVFQNNISATDIDGIASWQNGIWFGDSNGDIGTIDASGNVSYIQEESNVAPNTENCGAQEGAKVRRSGEARRSRLSLGPAAVAVSCGGINWMATGPDGQTLWFTDDDGFLGNVTLDGTITEWDLSQLPGGDSGSFPEPNQFVFGQSPDNSIYVADYDNLVSQVALSGTTPTSVNMITNGCGGRGGVAIGADGILWTSDGGEGCSDLYAIPMGSPFSAANFSSSNLQVFPLTALAGGDALGKFQATAAGIFSTTFDGPSVYRINEVTGGNTAAGVNSIQPVITNPAVGCECDINALALGPDANLWMGTSDNSIVRAAFGSPGVGLSTKLRAGALGARRPVSRTRPASRKPHHHHT